MLKEESNVITVFLKRRYAFFHQDSNISQQCVPSIFRAQESYVPMFEGTFCFDLYCEEFPEDGILKFIANQTLS
jgi:hypothetical protein